MRPRELSTEVSAQAAGRLAGEGLRSSPASPHRRFMVSNASCEMTRRARRPVRPYFGVWLLFPRTAFPAACPVCPRPTLSPRGSRRLHGSTRMRLRTALLRPRPGARSLNPNAPGAAGASGDRVSARVRVALRSCPHLRAFRPPRPARVSSRCNPRHVGTALAASQDHDSPDPCGAPDGCEVSHSQLFVPKYSMGPLVLTLDFFFSISPRIQNQGCPPCYS